MIKNPHAPFGSFQIIKQNLERLLIDLHRRDTSYTKGDRDVSIKQKSYRNVILCTVLNNMEQNINNKLTVKDICQQTMVGKSRLQDGVITFKNAILIKIESYFFYFYFL